MNAELTDAERARVQTIADKIAQAKGLAADALQAWDTLPDVDASSGELEQAVELLGRVEGDLDTAVDTW